MGDEELSARVQVLEGIVYRLLEFDCNLVGQIRGLEKYLDRYNPALGVITSIVGKYQQHLSPVWLELHRKENPPPELVESDEQQSPLHV